jgi:SAM-dependent methyltransferase
MPHFNPGAYDDHAATYGKRAATSRREFDAIRGVLAGRGPFATVLDVPCGNGRLRSLLRGIANGRLIGADAAEEMVRRADPQCYERFVSDASALPLRTGTVDLLVCMRLLHHYPSSARRVPILREFARVSRGLVLVSFYSRWTLEGLRRRYRPKRASTRFGVARKAFLADLEAAGLTPLAVRPLTPFVREQTLVLCQV